jgi:hypothetical protein
MTPEEIQAYVTELRQVEDQFFRTILNEPEMYMLGVRLVRAIADQLKSITDLGALIERFQRTGSDFVIPIADSLKTPQVMLLDYQLALGAGFSLRAQEIHDEQGEAALQSLVAAAKASNEAWIEIYNLETKRYGHTFFQRLEMHLPDGFSLYTASELDLERGLIYVVEPMLLDTETGRPRRGERPQEPRQEFATKEEMLQAAEALRRKYS